MADTEDVHLNEVNDDILDKNTIKSVSKNKLAYILLFLNLLFIIGLFVFLVIIFVKINLCKETENLMEKNAELVTLFFKDGYEYKNFDKVLTYMSDNYYDHSPASARSNKDAVNILKSVTKIFTNVTVEMLDLTCEKDMVAARIWFNVTHIGDYNGIPPTGKNICWEALENFKVVNGKIVESWGYWPDNQIEDKLKGD